MSKRTRAERLRDTKIAAIQHTMGSIFEKMIMDKSITGGEARYFNRINTILNEYHKIEAEKAKEVNNEQGEGSKDTSVESV